MKLPGFFVALTVALACAGVAPAHAETASGTVHLSISGMHCESCADGIRAILKRTEGVVTAEVSFEERSAVVEFDSSRTSPEKIVAAVEKLGYRAEIKGPEKERQQANRNSPRSPAARGR